MEGKGKKGERRDRRRVEKKEGGKRKGKDRRGEKKKREKWRTNERVGKREEREVSRNKRSWRIGRLKRGGEREKKDSLYTLISILEPILLHNHQRRSLL